jgi:hypothetical protein
MKKLAALVVCLSTASVFAQPPRLGPRQARLGYLAGHWTIEGEAEGAPIKINDTCAWFEGGFHLVCNREGAAGPIGRVKGQMTVGYAAAEGAYTMYSVNSAGSEVYLKGGVDGQTWTFAGEIRSPDGPVRVRMTITEQPPSAYAYRVEVSMAENKWQLLEQGRATKAEK